MVLSKAKQALMARGVVCLAFICGLGQCNIARAGIFELHGAGARATSMSGAQAAASRDHAAVFYNPAQLTARKKRNLSASLQLFAPNLTVNRSPGSPGDDAGGRDTLLPESNLGLLVGAVFPLGKKIGEPFAVGLLVFVPVLHFTRLDAVDPATPHFVLHQQLPYKLSLAAAGLLLVSRLGVIVWLVRRPRRR